MILGIDPGKNGGCVGLSMDGKILLNLHFSKITPVDFSNQMQKIARHVACAWMEEVNPFPRDSRSSAFAFGKTCGFTEGAVVFAGIKLRKVRPMVWQTYLKCRTKGDKKITRQRAQELFGTSITHADADAALIAEYGRRVDDPLNGLFR